MKMDAEIAAVPANGPLRQVREGSLHGRGRILRVTLTSATALLLGGIVYVLCRPAPHLFFTWLEAIGLGAVLEGVREQSLPLGAGVPAALVYSLPQGLWAFAYSLLIASFWGRHRSPVRWLWLGTIPLVAIGYELLQGFGYFTGTFCPQDLISGLAGASFGTILGWRNAF